jgi:RNA polymerase sigma factor (sigma-70 family)
MSPAESATCPAAGALSIETVYRRTFSYTWQLLGYLGIGRREDREDVSQNVYLTLLGKLDTYDPTMRLEAWVGGYAFRIARRYRQLARHYREQLTADPVEDAMDTEANDPEEHAAASDRRRIIQRALGTIDEDRRIVLAMYELQGIDMIDVVRALEIPLATGWSRLRRAKEDFAAAIHRLDRRDQDAIGVAGAAMVPLAALDVDRIFAAEQGDSRADVPSDVYDRLWKRIQRGARPRVIAAPLPKVAPLPGPAAGLAGRKLAGALAGLFLAGAGAGAAALYALLPRASAADEARARGHGPEAIPVATLAEDPAPSTALATSGAVRTVARSAPSLPAPAANTGGEEEGDERGESEGVLLQRANAALSGGRAGEAITLAQRHAAKYPRAKMGQERDVILIQAYLLAGQRAKAVELADRFRQASPSSPFLAVIDAALAAKGSP